MFHKVLIVMRRIPKRRLHHLQIIPMLLLLALALAVSCNGGDAAKFVRGHGIDVEARSITEVESLVIEDGSGEQWIFETEGNVGITPSHIQEHMLLGQELTVYYEEQDGRLVAIAVTD